MNKLTTKKICLIALLTALYCVLGAFIKIPIVGNISPDLGYIVLTIGCIMFGPWGAFIGAVGCGIESILFSAYGFSLGWFVGNLIIGLGCGYFFQKTNIFWKRVVIIITFVAIGIIGAKTGIECVLYGIPLSVKLVKSITAFVLDTIVMIFGLYLGEKLYNREP